MYSDSLTGAGSCSITESAPYVVPKASNGTPGELTVNYTCTGTDDTTTKNTATATWDKAKYATPNGSASGDAAVSFNVTSEINKVITVVDDKTTGTPVTLGTSDYNTGPFQFTYSLEKSGVGGKCTDYNNTAEIKETGQSATEKVTVCVGKDLTVSKTATATKTRTYKWLIDKSVDKTRVEIADGDKATFNYTVDVTPNGYTDSNHKVSGLITVSNPNYFDVTGVDVTDALDQGGSCSVTGGTNATIVAGGSKIFASSTDRRFSLPMRSTYRSVFGTRSWCRYIQS